MRTPSLVAVILVSTLSPTVRAQQRAPMERELRGIHRSLERIVELLERRDGRDQVLLLMRRVELQSDRLIPMERELRSLRAERTAAEEELRRVQAMLDTMEQQILEADSEEAERLRRDSAEERKQLALAVDRHKSLLWQLDDQLQGLEQAVASGRRELAFWQERIDRELAAE